MSELQSAAPRTEWPKYVDSQGQCLTQNHYYICAKTAPQSRTKPDWQRLGPAQCKQSRATVGPQPWQLPELCPSTSQTSWGSWEQKCIKQTQTAFPSLRLRWTSCILGFSEELVLSETSSTKFPYFALNISCYRLHRDFSSTSFKLHILCRLEKGLERRNSANALAEHGLWVIRA